MKLFKINIEFIILFAFLVFLSVLAILSTGYYEGADNISHLNISRFSFHHPELFLDQWGKPFFTLLSSPFAQFGFKGMTFFNILCGLLTSYYSFRIVKELNYKNAWIVLFFVTFGQYYFMMHLTALTEVLFSAVLVISVFFALRRKYLATAILLSFLPFIRNEGIVFFPTFFFYFLFYKKYWQIPFLLAGFVAYSLMGYFYFHDFFWIIQQNPYNNSAYGSGSYFHFINNLPVILGRPILTLFVCGIIVLIVFTLIKKKRTQNKEYILAEWLLILLPFLAYFGFHSFLWGKGIGGSAGLLRVISGVAPLAAIIALKGFNFFLEFLENKKILKFSGIVLVIVVIIYMPFRLFTIPVKLDEVGSLIKQAAAWIKQNENIAENKIYLYDPLFQQEFEYDPFSDDAEKKYFQIQSPPPEEADTGSVLIWDAHFGAVEGKTSIQSMMDNDKYKLIRRFEPAKEVIIMDRKYEICIFKKITH